MSLQLPSISPTRPTALEGKGLQPSYQLLSPQHQGLCLAHLQVLYRKLLNERLQDPAVSAAKLAHLFVAKYNAAIVVQSCLESEAAPVLPALEVDVVPLNNKDCPWGGEERAGWPGRRAPQQLWGRTQVWWGAGCSSDNPGRVKTQSWPLMLVTSAKSQALFCSYLIRYC